MLKICFDLVKLKFSDLVTTTTQPKLQIRSRMMEELLLHCVIIEHLSPHLSEVLAYDQVHGLPESLLRNLSTPNYWLTNSVNMHADDMRWLLCEGRLGDV